MSNATSIETREVLAGAYMSRSASMLSHAVEVDADGIELRVLCDRVELDNLADRFASDPYAAPTCKTCQRRLAARS
jgi:hypothetical protein